MSKQKRNSFIIFAADAVSSFGEMAERSKAAVLKTARAQVLGGSNPSLSVLCQRVLFEK